MKHWDGRDVAGVDELRLPRPDAARLEQMLPSPPPRARRKEPQIHSWIGLALSLVVLAGLAWAMTPAGPVSPKLLP